MANLSGIVEQLKNERDVVERQLLALNAVLHAFVGSYTGSAKSKGTRTMSAAARKKISLAQKARWAKHTTANGQESTARPKRIMSAAARKRIAAAQRARWAKVRAGKKAA
jgi:hypothetical protein